MVTANVQLTHQRLRTLENRTSMMAKAIMPALDNLKSRIANTKQKLTSQYRMMQMAHHRYNLLFRWMHEMLMIHQFALLLFKNYLTIQVGTSQRIYRQYNRYESALDDTLIGIESLSSGYLTHCILDPKILSRYLEAITDDMEDMAPDYKPVFTDVYQYYGNSLASFTNTIDDLIFQLPILIKLKVQVPMSLYSVDTVPIPLDAETYTGAKLEYTQILPKTEYIALTESNYVPLMQAQISLCVKIGHMYYCEYAHLLKKRTEYTCMSAIYYDQSSQIKADKCKMIVTFDTLPESKILDAGDILILSNLQKPWTIVCSLTAGNYLLSQAASNCGGTQEVKDGFFTTYYAFNRIVLDVLTEKFDIQVDDNTVTQSMLLHSDIPSILCHHQKKHKKGTYLKNRML